MSAAGGASGSAVPALDVNAVMSDPAQTSVTPGHSVVLIGPSGAGKSHLLRSALDHHGAGIALLAPGDDELESYRGLLGSKAHRIFTFGDPDFFPSAGSYDVAGHRNLVTMLQTLFRTNSAELQADRPLKYPVLVIDTWSGVDQLVVARALSKARQDSMPAAQSPIGGQVYGSIKLFHNEVMRGVRANRALGAHVLVACHIIERDAEIALGGAPGEKSVYMPALTGSFRDGFLAAFNLSLHVNWTNDPAWPHKHFAQLVSSDPKQLTKMRYRKSVSGMAKVPNEWSALLPLLDAARESSAVQQTQEATT